VSAAVTLEAVDGLESARAEWTRLADAAGSPFSTFEWATAWWRHCGDGTPAIRLCRDGDGRVAALLPLYATRRGLLRLLRQIGHGPADQLAPVCVPADRPLAAAGLLQALREARGYDLAVLDRFPGEHGWPGLLGQPVARREPSPVIESGGEDFDGWLRSRSRNFREQVRRRERKLARGHELTYRLCDDPDRLDADYDTLVRLHRARFGAESRSFDPPRDALHREFARAALERGWLRLWTLELDGRPAAAWLGYRMGGAEWYYQAGRDPALERESVGFVLMSHTIREAFDAGIPTYRMLLGDEAYKDRFANADHGLETVVVPRGVRGRAALAALRAAAAAPPGLRRRLRRAAG
jgi:CelD/BcsL family acetyltransferase involved in cellulose biosynthesis